VLTYRITGSLQRRPSAENPAVEELVLPLNATVDARRVREFLAGSGLLEPVAQERPSLALRVQPAAGLDPRRAAGPLAALRQQLIQAFEARELVVIEPALRATPLTGDESALDLARALGADVGLEVAVDWRPGGSGGVRGGIAEVSIQVRRASDGAALALARFEGAGYHPAPEEALLRALEAVRPQLVDNVALQLSQNWDELTRTAGPVEVQLLDVTSLLQVDAVRTALEGPLAAQSVELSELRPGGALLRVSARLSPGALQDRLAASTFEGFQLEAVAVDSERVSLRVRPAPSLELAPR
jgi:hypothetical protein